MTLAVDIQELQGGVVRARCVSLPGCVGYGASPEEAFQEMRAAIERFFAGERRVRLDYFGPQPVMSWN